MFGTVLTVLFALLVAYVTWRAATVPVLARRLSRKIFIGAGVGTWFVFFLARVVGHGGTGAVTAALEAVGMALLGSVFLIFTALFVVDVLTLFGRVFSKWAPTLRGIALVAGVALSGFALVQGLRAPAVVSYDVTLQNLPAELDGTVVVAISDAHIGGQLGDAWLADRAGEMQALHPDLVVFLGDIFEGHGDVPLDIPALRLLSPKLGKWLVDGNHDGPGRGGAGSEVLQKAGFRRLAEQWGEPAPGLVLAGVSDLTQHQRRNLHGDPLGRALANRPPGATLLLSHSPLQAERAARDGVQLMLSGHTHGGQIWPFGYLVQRVYPLLAGRYDVDGMPVIVSRGVGTWGPRMRLWHRGEVLKITLHAPMEKAGP